MYIAPEYTDHELIHLHVLKFSVSVTLIGIYPRSCVRQLSRRPSSQHVANAWQHVSRRVASNTCSYKWCDATWHEMRSYAAYCEQGLRNSKITLAIYGAILALCNDHSTLWQVRKPKQWLLTYTLKSFMYSGDSIIWTSLVTSIFWSYYPNNHCFMLPLLYVILNDRNDIKQW